jgi:hypothetical protein
VGVECSRGEREYTYLPSRLTEMDGWQREKEREREIPRMYSVPSRIDTVGLPDLARDEGCLEENLMQCSL